MSYANGNITQYTYDSLNRLIDLTTDDGLGGVLLSYAYTLDPTGRRTQITENSGRVTDYVYDELYRLTQETITDSVNGNYSAQYQYDQVGNRTQSIIDGETVVYSYDDNDRLMEQGGTSYTYDDNGNTLTETLDGVTKTYSYNSQNELISVDDTLDTTAYQYNVDGVRTQQSIAGIATDYLVDHNRDYAQVITESENGAATVQYTYGDDLISQERDGNTSTYLYDGLGSARGLSNDSGSLANTYDYTAFGEVLNQTGSTLNNYLFTGEQFDSQLNQYYLRARYYNQQIGRMHSMDTYQGRMHEPATLHKYLYVHADPVNNIDPSGNITLSQSVAAIGVLGILTTTAVNQYQLGQNLAGTWDGDTGLTSSQSGWLILVAMLGTQSSIFDRLSDKVDQREETGRDITLFHGTTNSAAKKIKKRGFSEAPVFLAEDFATASAFGRIKAAERGSPNATVFIFTIPEVKGDGGIIF